MKGQLQNLFKNVNYIISSFGYMLILDMIRFFKFNRKDYFLTKMFNLVFNIQ